MASPAEQPEAVRPLLAEDQFRHFVEHAPVAIAMFDRRMRYLAASRRWIDDYGLRGRDFEGRSQYELFPETPQSWRDMHARAMDGEIFSAEEDRLERPDGTVQWLKWDVRPWYGADGGIGGILISTEDVTRRKAAEEEVRHDREMLRAGEERYRAMFEGSPNAIILIDDTGTIEAVNPALLRLFGYDATELVGANVSRLMPESEAAAHDGHLRRYAETDLARIVGIGRVVTAKRKDGTLFPAQLAVATWRNENGSRLYFGALTDLTERRHSERMMAERHRLDAIGLLAGGVAHDFNNSLAVILGNLDLAEPRIADRVARDLVGRALQAAKVASTVTRRLLALSRHPDGERQTVFLNDIVRETAPLLESLVSGPWKLRTTLAEQPWPILVQPGEVCSALLNLVANGRDAMPDGGTIEISTHNVHVADGTAAESAPGDYACLSVTDTGGGMPPEVVEKVWDPFYSTKKPGRGTGLGLTTVRTLAKLSGGFAKLVSAPGKGTVVTLCFPRAAAAGQAPDGADDAAVPLGDGETILVVDDDEEVRETAMKRLEALGYAVIPAEGGEQAIAELQRGETIDLVFADVAMPGMSGYGLARWLGLHRPGTPIVLTSGFPGAADDDDAPADGPPLLLKPYGREQLARRIRQALTPRACDQPQNT